MAAKPLRGARLSKKKPDFASIAGVVLAVGGILGGMVLEGGNIRDVAQITAAVIVFGGTLGAVMLSTPPAVLGDALRQLPWVFVDETDDPGVLIDELVRFANKARKEGILSIERAGEAVPDPFLRKALGLAVDGTDMQELRRMMELDIQVEGSRGDENARVYEAAGGYAPTVGIIGAVLGLIQVMKHLENIEEVGHGIAVAFVATVYGVASANLFFLPASLKIKARQQRALQHKELQLEGVMAIVEGLNPKLIRIKLQSYVRTRFEGGRRSTDERERAEARWPAEV